MKILLHLRKRNKRDVIGLAMVEGNITRATPVDLDKLNLGKDLKEKIRIVCEEHKMNYELWAQPFKDSSSFAEELMKSGMKQIPMKFTPRFDKQNTDKKSFRL